MIQYEVSAGRATITIDEPARRNPLSVEAMAGLLDATHRAMGEPEVGVIVYTGAGDAAFSAGGDLSGGFVEDPIGLHTSRGALADLFRLMVRGGKPTVARVNGHALAGGFGLAVACDFVVCVADAKLGTPEIGVGLWPMMISAVLLRSMPAKAVLDLMVTGRIIDPSEAQSLGAVTRVVERPQLDEAVDEIVGTILAQSPATLELGRDSFYAIADMGFDAALDRLQAGLTAVALTDDSKEGVAAFGEKRPPNWSGR
ncbi:MAG TPA: enoyl-CoA hydratase-related protein [Acidimicrobiia bacterium]|nr:enoyl-CoA hydratase-related protein [Acidimicrobiia bacterium]